MQPVVLGRRESPVEWHEAAALVHTVADAVAGGTFTGVPPVTDLALAEDGTVCAAPGAASRVANLSQDELARVASLRRLLADLLPDTAPPQLVALARDEDDGSGARTSDEFVRTLAFFERPSKDRDLRALVARLRLQQESMALDAELARLTEKARHEPSARPAGDQPIGSTAPRKVRRVLARALVLIGLLAIAVPAVLIALSFQGGGPSPDDGKPANPANRLVAKLRAAVAATIGGDTTAPQRVAPQDGGRTAGRKPRRSPASGAPIRASVPRPAAAVPLYSLSQPEIVEVFAADGFNLEPTPGLPRESGTLYDERDSDVTPAMVLRPRLAAIPPGASERHFGQLEVLVAEDGRVEGVRLVSTTIERRYYDMMMLAAVKAWVFKPASRAGRPVRYRLRVPLT